MIKSQPIPAEGWQKRLSSVPSPRCTLNHIEQATKLARAMVTRLGMSDNFGMMALETVNNQYLGVGLLLACSEETAAKIDQEVCTLIAQCHDHAKEILLQNMPKLHELASYLLEKETITGEEFYGNFKCSSKISGRTRVK